VGRRNDAPVDLAAVLARGVGPVRVAIAPIVAAADMRRA
jgi:hypothetical protein